MNVISSLHFGGAETQVINLSKELAKQGHQVLLVSLTNDVPRIAELEGSTVEIIVENKKRKLDLTVLSNLRTHIKKWQPDIIHGYLYDAEFYCRLAAIGLSIPVINSERNDNYTFNKNQILGDYLTTRLVNGVIANSYAGMSFSKKRYQHLNEKNFHVVWNGIDLDNVNQRVSHCDKDYKQDFFNNSTIKMACMVASIKEQKDYVLALQVAEKLIQSDEQWRVIFLGDKLFESDDSYKKTINLQYNNLNEKSKIKFLGNRTDVIEILSQAEVSFLTSHYEGFPNAVLESMSVGTPAITTHFSDIKKIAPAPWMVIDNHQPQDFVKAINKAVDEKPTLSYKSIKWVNEHCTLDVIARKLIDTYSLYI